MNEVVAGVSSSGVVVHIDVICTIDFDKSKQQKPT